MFVFVSDLHLGDGQALEDFALWPGRLPRRKSPASIRSAVRSMHECWRDFIVNLAHHATRAPEPVELLLLGDIFDLLQVEGDLCDPEKIDRVARAHAPWFDTLAGIERRGVAVSLVVGNHDHELFDPDVWERLLSYAPFINRHWDSRPLAAWRCPRLGIHAEHGSQLDWTNAFDAFHDPRALSLGSHIVLHLINAFEPRCPLLDLMPDVHTALWYALAHAPGLVARPLREFLFKGAGDGETPPNLDFLPELEGLLRRVWLRELPRPHRRRLRSALALIANALGGDGSKDDLAEEVTARKIDASAKDEEERTIILDRRERHPMEKIQEAAAGQLPPPGRARLRKLLEPPAIIDKKSSIPGRRANQPGDSLRQPSDNLARGCVASADAPGAELSAGKGPNAVVPLAKAAAVSDAPHAHALEIDSAAIGQLGPKTAREPAPGCPSANAEVWTPRVVITGHTHQPGIATARNGTRWVNTGSWKARARPAGRRCFAIDQPLDVVIIRECPAGDLDIALRSARDADIFKAPAS